MVDRKYRPQNAVADFLETFIVETLLIHSTVRKRSLRNSTYKEFWLQKADNKDMGHSRAIEKLENAFFNDYNTMNEIWKAYDLTSLKEQ